MQKKDTRLRVYFLIGAVVGIILFLAIYGFRILNVTYDGWLLTGKDLQQHYLGWKFFRKAPWSFPLGMHDFFTNPDSISVLYTDSIPLFALFFKLLSPILPSTFQYFGLFGLMCYILNGGMASLIVSRFNKSCVFCGVSSVFFIISTPVLQRLFGVLSENSRHTSLAAHFLIFGALFIWLYQDRFESYKKDAIAWAVLAALCVLIQMYIIFMVGGIMCGYLLNKVIAKRDWKRVFIDFGAFVCSFGFFFFIVGGFTSLLSSGGSGYGFFSANLNTFINPWRYSTFLKKMGMNDLQYEGFAYLGLGMLLLCAICFVMAVIMMIRLARKKQLSTYIKAHFKKRYAMYIPGLIVVFVFAILAFSNLVYLGRRIFIEVHWPTFIDNLLAVIRSSGRFIWCVMYIIMIVALFFITKVFSPKWQKVIVIFCICLQIADLYTPIHRLQKQYQKETHEDDSLVKSDFWKTTLGNFDRVVYYPSDGYDATQMLQIGSKVSNFDDIKMSNFYLSRYMTKKQMRIKDRQNVKIFTTGNLDEKTLYLLDFARAHKYKDKCYMYVVDNKIIAVKNPILGLEPYKDFLVGSTNPEVKLDMSFAGLGKNFLHKGWHSQLYKDKGAWTTKQSVMRIYSDDAKKIKVTIDYKAGKKKGTTYVKMNGRRIGKIDNLKSGTVTFEAKVKPCEDIKKVKYINWLFLECDTVKEPKKAGDTTGKGIMVKNVTLTYVE